MKAVVITMMALPSPIEPKIARKMSELEKIDQVGIGCFVTEFSIASREGTVNQKKTRKGSLYYFILFLLQT